MPRIPEYIPIDEGGLKELVSELEAKSKQPKVLPLGEFLERLRKPAQKMLEAGYSYGDISKVLKQRKIHIPAATIQQYFAGDKPKAIEVESQSREGSGKRVELGAARIGLATGKKVKGSVSSPKEIADNTEAESPFIEDEAELKRVKAAQAKGFNVIEKDKL